MKTRLLCIYFAVFSFLTCARTSFSGEGLLVGDDPTVPSISIIEGGKFTFSLHEKYIARRISRVLSDDTSWSTDLSVNFKNDFYLSLWQIHGLDGDFSGGSEDEVQFTIGKNFKFDFDKDLGFMMQVSYFNLHPFERWGEDRLCFDLKLSKVFKRGNLTLSPEIWFSWLALSDDPTHGGSIFRIGYSSVWDKPFGLDFLQITSVQNLNRDSGVGRNTSDGLYLWANTAAEWKVGRSARLIFPAYTSLVKINGNDDRESAGSWWGGVRLNW